MSCVFFFFLLLYVYKKVTYRDCLKSLFCLICHLFTPLLSLTIMHGDSWYLLLQIHLGFLCSMIISGNVPHIFFFKLCWAQNSQCSFQMNFAEQELFRSPYPCQCFARTICFYQSVSWKPLQQSWICASILLSSFSDGSCLLCHLSRLHFSLV